VAAIVGSYPPHPHPPAPPSDWTQPPDLSPPTPGMKYAHSVTLTQDRRNAI
ncbi:unnamed protein product, partial [Gadus morhua 'NCC']